ncbi:chemotaxis protein CheB [Kamptonema formosum]|uniref:chemotaxis protein CheB n=1 Tax=Kamptonema formosum TaxID=331992 RepID=UPI0003499FB2|nr:chemotaxis protein CheB [Oscillatoria sp. PCC 10802]
MRKNQQQKTPAPFSEAPFDIIAIAASAGGLKALSAVLSELKADLPVAIVVVQHLAPNHPSQMAEILTRRTPLEVKQATDRECLKPGTVYIAPPDRHLLVNPDRSLSLSQSEKVHFVRPSAEVLFESVASSYKNRAIAVVLTGADRDGTQGVRAIKNMGGVVIAQNKETSLVFGMPGAAIDTGCVDFILPLQEIPGALTDLVFQGSLG